MLVLGRIDQAENQTKELNTLSVPIIVLGLMEERKPK